jgi:large subunit ribosomal protein L29
MSPKAKAKDFRSLSDAEIELKKSTLGKALFELRQKQVTGQLEKPHEFKQLRRQIAQLNTIQREKKK